MSTPSKKRLVHDVLDEHGGGEDERSEDDERIDDDGYPPNKKRALDWGDDDDEHGGDDEHSAPPFDVAIVDGFIERMKFQSRMICEICMLCVCGDLDCSFCGEKKVRTDFDRKTHSYDTCPTDIVMTAADACYAQLTRSSIPIPESYKKLLQEAFETWPPDLLIKYGMVAYPEFKLYFPRTVFE